MKHLTPLGKLLNVLSFYKWAFGDLTESDSDVGVLAEYLVGDLLGCLPPTRKVNAPFDLKTKSGVTIEVKATTHKYDPKRGRTPYYRWDVTTQSEALKGNSPIADFWVFLIASFPREISRTPRVVQAFDIRNWTCCVATGEQLRASGCTKYISESTLRRLGLESIPLAGLKKCFKTALAFLAATLMFQGCMTAKLSGLERASDPAVEETYHGNGWSRGGSWCGKWRDEKSNDRTLGSVRVNYTYLDALVAVLSFGVYMPVEIDYRLNPRGVEGHPAE